jgi:hypothetical protein
VIITPDFKLEVIDRLSRIEANTEHSKVAVGDHEVRLRSVEKRLWIIGGLAVLIGPLLAKLGIPGISLAGLGL